MITRTVGRSRTPVPFVPAFLRCFLWEEWLKEQQGTFQGAKEWEAVYHRSFKLQVISTTKKVGTSWPYGIYFGCVFLSYHLAIHPAQRPPRLFRNCDLGSHFQVGQVITVCLD